MKPMYWLLPFALGIGLTSTGVDAQNWPTKPLRAVIPIGAGGPTDIIPRIVFEQLSAQLGQAIVVENRVGAGGTAGAAFVAKANADGYTLLANGSGHAIAPALYPHLSFDPARDFTAVIPFCTSSSALVVSPARRLKSVGDFVAAARKRPTPPSFASVGAGTFTHLSAERFRASAGIEAVHVPFKSGPAAIVEVMAERIDFFFAPITLALPQIRDGKLSALAVNGVNRSAVLPDVPTLSEAGFANAEYPVWFGLFLPAKVPANIVDKLYSETRSALRTSQVRDRLSATGCDEMPMTSAEFGAHVEKEISLNTALIKAIGLKAD